MAIRKLKSIKYLSAIGAFALSFNALSEDDFGLTQLKSKPWYEKISSFANLDYQSVNIDIKRASLLNHLDYERFTGSYHTHKLSLTSGGNLLPKTSIYLDLNISQIKLDGKHQTFENEDIFTKRYKTQGELFVEHNLNTNYSLGLDMYYGIDNYNNTDNSNIRRYNEDLGGGLSISRYFKFDNDRLKLDYIYSFRKVNVSHSREGDSSKGFHSILINYHHPFSYDLSTDLVLRGSFYPKYNPYQYWETEKLWSISNLWRYRLNNNTEVQMSFDRLSFANNSSSNTITMNFQYFFSGNESKRRKRRHKLPNLLLK